MTSAVPDILSRIVSHKKSELFEASVPTADLEKLAETAVQTRRSFRRSIEAKPTAVIAEIKKASPSKGLLSAQFRPKETAEAYEQGGAAALSVLTDRQFFQGSFEDLETARSATGLPVLRKDFTIDPYHVVEAAAHNADAILLIAAILTERELLVLREQAESYKLDAIVEVHDGDELQRALASGASIIGVNNRNLHSFEVDLATSLRLAESIPGDVLKVSESGIGSPHDIAVLKQAGYQAFLVGEHLMRSGNPREALEALLR